MSKYFEQVGVTLVELLVSMAIGLFILAGVVGIVLSSRSTYQTEQEGSFIQENARYAVEVLSRDIRLAGSYGCADLNNVKIALTAADTPEALHSYQAVYGYANSLEREFIAQADQSEDSPVLILRYGDPDKTAFISTHNPAANRFVLDRENPFDVGEKLAIVDSNCRSMAFFQGSADENAVVYAGAENCSNLFPAADLDVCSPSTAAYSAGAQIMSHVSVAYYVAPSSVESSLSALKRVSIAGDGVTRTDELAQGVESIEILYGVDRDHTNGEPVGDVDGYLSAELIAADSDFDWSSVGAVRFKIVFRSLTAIFEEDARANQQDRYLRQIAASTVKIRNR